MTLNLRLMKISSLIQRLKGQNIVIYFYPKMTHPVAPLKQKSFLSQKINSQNLTQKFLVFQKIV